MGNFKIVVEAVGGHGCQREVKDGGIVNRPCMQPGCPDCMADALVRNLKSTAGCSVQTAKLIHWADSDGGYKRDTVVDNLLTGVRHGSFGLAYEESNLDALNKPGV